MIEYQRPNESGSRALPKIKIVAVGGAGMSALDRLALDGAPDAELVAMNTDMQNLAGSVVPIKIQIGADITRGLGTGGDPEIGYQAAEDASAELSELLENTHMLILCGGLGGGTGSGAMPVLAKMAKDRSILVISVVTLPFEFEGRRRHEQAAQALTLVDAASDAVICFENDRMGEAVLPKAGIHQAFAAADMTISQCIRSMIDMVTRHGIMEIGFDGLLATVRRSASRSVFGYGEASGENRCHDALAVALKNPLLDRGNMLENARHLIVNIVGGNQLALHEVETLMEEVCRHVHDQTNIFLGVTIDPQLGARMSVTLLSSIGGEVAEKIERGTSQMQATSVSPYQPPVSKLPLEPLLQGQETFTPPAAQMPVLKPVKGQEETPALSPALGPLLEKQEARPATVHAEIPQLVPPSTGVSPASPTKSPAALPPRREGASASKKPVDKEALAKQETLQFEPVNRGRFEKSEPTIEDGQDLDIPAFLRKKVSLK